MHSFLLPLVPFVYEKRTNCEAIIQPSKDHFEIIDIPFIATPDAIPSWFTFQLDSSEHATKNHMSHHSIYGGTDRSGDLDMLTVHCLYFSDML